MMKTLSSVVLGISILSTIVLSLILHPEREMPFLTIFGILFLSQILLHKLPSRSIVQYRFAMSLSFVLMYFIAYVTELDGLTTTQTKAGFIPLVVDQKYRQIHGKYSYQPNDKILFKRNNQKWIGYFIEVEPNTREPSSLTTSPEAGNISIRIGAEGTETISVKESDLIGKILN